MTATIAAEQKIRDLPVDRLTIGEDVRLDEDGDELTALSMSIKAIGVLQPLVVRPRLDGWEVVAGRRRLAAARIAGLVAVPCVIRTLTAEAAFDIALAENLHRRQLSWIEVALAYDRLRSRGLKQRQIAELVGKSNQHVSFILKLLTVPQELQDRVHRREISYMTALDLAQRNKTVGDGSGNSSKGKLTGADAEIATHWRRRHDRLVAGIVQTINARDLDAHDLRNMLERLLKLDRQPLADKDAA